MKRKHNVNMQHHFLCREFFTGCGFRLIIFLVENGFHLNNGTWGQQQEG